MTTNNGNIFAGGVVVLHLRDESGGTDDIKGGDTEQALRVVDALRLEDLSGDGDCGVDLRKSVYVFVYKQTGIELAYRIGDDQNIRLGCMLGSSLSQITDNRGICVEQVCT